MEWEEIDDRTARAMVVGGWLVKVLDPIWEHSRWSGNHHIALTFVPDPSNEWVLPPAEDK